MAYPFFYICLNVPGNSFHPKNNFLKVRNILSIKKDLFEVQNYLLFNIISFYTIPIIMKIIQLNPTHSQKQNSKSPGHQNKTKTTKMKTNTNNNSKKKKKTQ